MLMRLASWALSELSPARPLPCAARPSRTHPSPVSPGISRDCCGVAQGPRPPQPCRAPAEKPGSAWVLPTGTCSEPGCSTLGFVE